MFYAIINFYNKQPFKQLMICKLLLLVIIIIVLK